MVYGHRWSREEGGGGVTCIIQDGETFEKACVYFCLIYFYQLFPSRRGSE